jgi:pectinesterase
MIIHLLIEISRSITTETKEGLFPSWFSRNEKKLLQTNSPLKFNLVVAKDGSGNFKTVQAALDAAAKRKYKTRFVIHVKKGVYKENIEVAVHNDNIMLVGDGMQNTIITSSRSVQGGFTTYSSATAGELYSSLFSFYVFKKSILSFKDQKCKFLIFFFVL